MAKLQAGRGAHATILTKYIKPPQQVPNARHQSNIVLLDCKDKIYQFYLRADNDNGNEDAPVLHASCRYVKVTMEGNQSLFLIKIKNHKFCGKNQKQRKYFTTIL